MEQIIINGDNLEVLKKYPDNYFDAVVTDPPYGLGKEPNASEVMQSWVSNGYHEIKGSGFMGKEWDAFVPQPIFWKEVFRVLKHGGHVLSFFGTRTYDWGVMSMRFAGFDVKDCLQWNFGSGFPKSHNIINLLKNDLLCKVEKKSVVDAVMSSFQSKEAKDMDGQNIVVENVLARVSEKGTIELVKIVNNNSMLQKAILIENQEQSKGHFVLINVNLNGKKRTSTLKIILIGKEENLLEQMDTLELTWEKGNIDLSILSLLKNISEEELKKEKMFTILTGLEQIIELKICNYFLNQNIRSYIVNNHTAIKPANEPIVLARKPLEKGLSIAENVLKWGTGGINIDGCRVSTNELKSQIRGSGVFEETANGIKTGFNKDEYNGEYNPNVRGRFPANIILTHHPECEYKGLKKIKPSNGSGKASDKGGGFSKGMFGDGTSDNIGGGFIDENGQETVEDWECVNGGELISPCIYLEGIEINKFNFHHYLNVIQLHRANSHILATLYIHNKDRYNFLDCETFHDLGWKRLPSFRVYYQFLSHFYDALVQTFQVYDQLSVQRLNDALDAAHHLLELLHNHLHQDHDHLSKQNDSVLYSLSQHIYLNKSFYSVFLNKISYRNVDILFQELEQNDVRDNILENKIFADFLSYLTKMHLNNSSILHLRQMLFCLSLEINFSNQIYYKKFELPDCPIKIMDEQSGVSKSPNKVSSGGKTFHGEKYDSRGIDKNCFGDTGGASRFFYVAKASKSERNKGLDKERWFNNLELVFNNCSFTEQNLFIWEQGELNQNTDWNGEAQQKKDISEGIVLLVEDKECYTTLCGNEREVLFPKAIKFTTSTGLSQTIELKTLNYYQLLNINDCIADVIEMNKENGLSLAENVGMKNLLRKIFTKDEMGFLLGVKIVAKKTPQIINVKDVWQKSNIHSTVKPVKLMQYLVRLVTPPKGKVLDPFAGSGTTGIACKLEGFEFVGIEQEVEYCKIAEARIKNFVEEKNEEQIEADVEKEEEPTKNSNYTQQTLF